MKNETKLHFYIIITVWEHGRAQQNIGHGREKNQFLIKSNGIKYELIDGKYKQSYNIQTEYEIPVQVMILKGDIIRARQNHQTITAT